MESFIKRFRYSSYAFINKETFLYLLDRLKQLGFDSQTIILPQVSISDGKNISMGREKKVIFPQEFLDLNEKFDAIILRALNVQGEEIAILFKNDSNKKIGFDYPIFQIVEKSPIDNIYISTNDPSRTYGLAGYFKDFFRDKVQNPYLRKFLIFSTIFIGAGGVYFQIQRSDKPTITLGIILLGILLWIVVLSKILPPTGLKVIVTKRNFLYSASINELQKNWLAIIITVLLSFSFGLLGDFISKYFGW